MASARAELDDLAHAVGQPRDQAVAALGELEEIDHLLHRFALRAASARRTAGVNSSSCHSEVRAVPVAADQQVLQHGRVLEQLDVLEGARDAELGDTVRRETGQLAVLEADPAAASAG